MRLYHYYFIVLIALTALGACSTVKSPELQITISAEDAQRIGQQIWQNEGAGKIEHLLVWNAGEDFPSLGIGHFIWFPHGVRVPFQESFPSLIPYLANSPYFPAWLHQQTHAPWISREQFQQQINSSRSLELRRLLHHTFAQQTQFIIARVQRGLPSLLKQIDNPQQRQHVEKLLTQLLQQPAGTYAVVDYINFKGEGTSEKERYQGKGWGLLQVLLEMSAQTNDVVSEFARAADTVLTRRVANAPRDESRWLPGWRKRLQTYPQFARQASTVKDA